MADYSFITMARAWGQQASKMADAGIGAAFETLPGPAPKRLHADGAGRQPGHLLGELTAPDTRHGLPAASTPCSAKTFLARSIPRNTTVMVISLRPAVAG